MLSDINNFQKSHYLLNYFEIHAVGFVSIKKFMLYHGPWLIFHYQAVLEIILH